MKLPRRTFFHLAAGAVAMPAAARFASAQAYPTRPVRVLIGTPPGGANDIFARLIGQWLSERLGQPFIIENRPGAAGNIATETVVRSAPDGYTLLLIFPPAAINATLYDKLNFNFLSDISPVAGISSVPNVVQVNTSFPAKTISELIAHAKANPGKINFGTGGIGTAAHMAGELFKMMTGVDIVHVPYRGGGPALTDLLGGQIQLMFSPLTVSIDLIRAGKVRALAVTSTARSDAVPDLPTVADFVQGYEASAWFGIGAPRNTPNDVVDKLNKEINAGLADTKMIARLAEQGGTPLVLSPTEFRKLIIDETDKWGKVVKFVGLKPE